MNNKKIVFKNMLLFLLGNLLLGCASRATLGTRNHVFSDKGKHIIWFQIEGLLPEHLPLIKYTNEKATDAISFEKMSCSGTLWSHNLYEMRPEPDLGFMSQILGSQNIKGECSDIDRKPIWSYFQEKGYEVAVLESSGMGKRSLAKYGSCKEKIDLFSDIHFWRRNKTKDKEAKLFHYLDDRSGLETPGTYYDKSCQERGCFVTFINNLKSMWKNFKNKNAKTFTVVRDSRYSDELNKGNIVEAMDILRDWDKYFSELISQSDSRPVTILITSSAGRGIEFPKKGAQWARFIKKGKSILYRNQSLTSAAWSFGPGAENFCGLYEEDKIFNRILWAPEKRFLDELLF